MYIKTNRNSEYKNTLLDFIKHKYGIDATSITSAKRGFFGEAVIGVFDWIEGDNIETDETKIPEYSMMAKVYTAPAAALAISTEDFFGGSADKFFHQWNDLGNSRLNILFEKNRDKLEFRANRLKILAGDCRNDKSGFVITHGDAGGNLIKGKNGYYIVDWDEAKLAPPERDAWNMLNYEGKSGWARLRFMPNIYFTADFKKHSTSRKQEAKPQRPRTGRTGHRETFVLGHKRESFPSRIYI